MYLQTAYQLKWNYICPINQNKSQEIYNIIYNKYYCIMNIYTYILNGINTFIVDWSKNCLYLCNEAEILP